MDLKIKNTQPRLFSTLHRPLIQHLGLLHKLTNLYRPNFLYNIICSFLTNRSFQVRTGTYTSQLHPIKAGVPQGSVLGPMLFNIFCHNIRNPQMYQFAMYADDTAIITQNTNLECSIRDLQSSIDQIAEWFSKWKLKLNPTKSEAKIFTLRRHTNPTQVKIIKI